MVNRTTNIQTTKTQAQRVVIEINTWPTKSKPYILTAKKYAGNELSSITNLQELLSMLRYVIDILPYEERTPRSGFEPRYWTIEVTLDRIAVLGGKVWGFTAKRIDPSEKLMRKYYRLEKYFSYTLAYKVLSDVYNLLLAFELLQSNVLEQPLMPFTQEISLSDAERLVLSNVFGIVEVYADFPRRRRRDP